MLGGVQEQRTRGCVCVCESILQTSRLQGVREAGAWVRGVLMISCGTHYLVLHTHTRVCVLV